MKHLAHDLSKLISRDKILSEPEDLFAYAGDATFQQAQKTPDLVVLFRLCSFR